MSKNHPIFWYSNISYLSTLCPSFLNCSPSLTYLDHNPISIIQWYQWRQLGNYKVFCRWYQAWNCNLPRRPNDILLYIPLLLLPLLHHLTNWTIWYLNSSFRSLNLHCLFFEQEFGIKPWMVFVIVCWSGLVVLKPNMGSLAQLEFAMMSRISAAAVIYWYVPTWYRRWIIPYRHSIIVTPLSCNPWIF